MIEDSKKNLANLNKDSLADQIFEVLRKRIIDLEISPGEKLDVESLTDEFEVSKAPVRDAMKALADRGLIMVKPRVGYYAAELDSNDIQDIYDMRELFEIYALEEALEKVPDNLIEECKNESLAIKEKNISEEEKRRIFDKTDEILHQKIILSHADNRFLKDFTARIHDLISLTRHLNSRIPQSVNEHLEILSAFKRQDKESAKKLLKHHLNQVRKETLRSITEKDLATG